jgi:GIY-YIG catalytic domain
MSENAFVTWVQHTAPWEIEGELIRELRPPLNLAENASHSFYGELSQPSQAGQSSRTFIGRAAGWFQPVAQTCRSAVLGTALHAGVSEARWRNEQLQSANWSTQAKDKRYVRRSPTGQFKESDDVGRSLKRDRQQKAKRKVKSGQGDRGDRLVFAFFFNRLGCAGSRLVTWVLSALLFMPMLGRSSVERLLSTALRRVVAVGRAENRISDCPQEAARLALAPQPGQAPSESNHFPFPAGRTGDWVRQVEISASAADCAASIPPRGASSFTVGPSHRRSPALAYSLTNCRIRSRLIRSAGDLVAPFAHR